MENIKSLFTTYINLEALADAAEEAWSHEPDSKVLENAFDEAYQAEFAAGQMLINELVSFTNGKIDAQIARKMLATKREELGELIAKI